MWTMPELTLKTFGEWNKLVAPLAGLEEAVDIPGRLTEALGSLVHCDERAVLVFSENQKPLNACEWTIPQWPEEDLLNYMNGVYLLDPFYRAGINGIDAGLYCMAEIAPPGFIGSEYHKAYYEGSPIKDEIGYIVYLEPGVFANVSLNRSTQSPDFSEQEVKLLRECLPTVQAALDSYWSRTASTRKDSGSEVYIQLESALDVFGTSVLTPREAEIMRLYLYGHDTRSISEKLEISTHTVSVHRKNAYARLDINSQAELFSLFISSMYCFQGEADIDPLARYLNPPE